MARIDYSVDPFASDAAQYLHIQSTEYSGDFKNITVASSANFPNVLSDTPTRYFVYFEYDIDVSDLTGSRPILIKDVTTATTLTRVTGSPSTNEYRVHPSDSNLTNVIELHSGQAAHEIGYDFYSLGSQITAEVADRLSPVGEIIIWPASTAPNGFVECDGSSLLRTEYADLFAVIGITYGNADSTHFNVPDMRGYFVRGWDNSAGNDPDSSSRTDRGDGTTGDYVGTKQSDEFEAHTHTIDLYTPVGTASLHAQTSGNTDTTDTATGSAGGSTETRPLNINMMYCIRYK